MCGICGYYGNYKENDLDRMVALQSHRGPDSTGKEFFRDGEIGFGHNRLAIIDLTETGKQPMFNEDKSVCIVFNGEIYNYKDIRTQLTDKHTFNSLSDTEVIIHAYEEWGYECLKKLNGMFSFVIYDLKKDLIFGARDRLGEKPLKYLINERGFAFASEVKSLLSILDHKPELDPIAINHFLTFQYVPSPRTGFKGISKLPPAHFFTYKNGKMEIKRYWELKFDEKENHTELEWQSIILHELEQSVKARLMSDVPIGALLSGGVDSSAVVAFMAKNSPGKINTFSIGFDDKKFDETKYAKMIAEKYDTNHTVLNLESNSLSELLPTLANYYDEPIADNSIIPTFLVSKITRKHVTVALDGDGGDENFAGYERHSIVNVDMNIVSKTPKFLLNIAKYLGNTLFAVSQNKFTERLKRYLNSSNLPYYNNYVNYNCFFTNEEKTGLFTKDFQSKIDNDDSFEFYKELFDPQIDLLDNALKIDLNTYLPDNLLYKVDTASMANSLELRAPFLDYRLMEKFAKIPSNLKVKGLEKKYILKKALVEANLLPAEVVYRKKQGFNVPLNTWFKGNLKNYVYDTALSDKFTKSGIFEKRSIDNYVNDYYRTELNYDNNIFSLLVLSNWVEKYL